MPALLRDQLLDLCAASGADTNAVVQGLIDALMIAIIATGPTDDVAERNVRGVGKLLATADVRKA